VSPHTNTGGRGARYVLGMSTALVANATIVSNAARAYRATAPTAYQQVDPLDTDSFAARSRDQARGRDEQEFSAPVRQPQRRGFAIEPVGSFGGVLVSREVGTTMMQAQALLTKTGTTTHPAEAERNVAIYESNQALMGAPIVTTTIGVMH